MNTSFLCTEAYSISQNKKATLPTFPVAVLQQQRQQQQQQLYDPYTHTLMQRIFYRGSPSSPHLLFMARPKRANSSSSADSSSSSRSNSKTSSSSTNPLPQDTENGNTDAQQGNDTDEWMAMVAAFQVYKAAYGDLKVPSRFIVPSMMPWPESAWGMKLGLRVASIRATGKFITDEQVDVKTRMQRRKMLDDLGFLWRVRVPSLDTSIADTTTFDQIYSALITYKQEIHDKQRQVHDERESQDLSSTQEEEEDDDYGEDDEDQLSLSSSSLIIPKNFIVPNYAPWPEETQGLPLGKMITTIRSKAFLKANPDAAEKLQTLGFELDGKAAANEAKFSLVYKALASYKQIYGDLLVPQPFVIPAQSPGWPQETWGLRLGARVNAIRSQGTFIKTNPEREQLLNDLGFEWDPSTSTKIAAGAKKKGRKKKETDEKEVDQLKKAGGSIDIRPPLSSMDFYLEDDTESEETLRPLKTTSQYPAVSTIKTRLATFIDQDDVVVDDDDDDDEASTDYKDEDDDDFTVENDEEESMLSSLAGNMAIRDFAGNMAMRDSRMASIIKETVMVPPQVSNEEYQGPKDLNATLMAAADMAKAVGVIESMGYVQISKFSFFFFL